MNKVKSALEIALERSRRVSEKADTAQEWEEQQHRAVGENLARRFLKQEITTWDLRSHLAKYQGKAREQIARAAAVALARELRLDNYARLLEGIATLKEDEAGLRWVEETKRACEQFEAESAAEESEVNRRWAEKQREELARLGISGTAIVGFNLRSAGEWEKRRQVWDQRLAEIRRRLVEFLES
ncbi:MAG: hypothetical protein ACPLRW_00405 [Moorellales bacterium]